MPSPAFVDLVNQQIGHEFAASNQYIAVAIHYDAETLPAPARLLLPPGGRGAQPRDDAHPVPPRQRPAARRSPRCPRPAVDFPDIVEPVDLALAQEQRVTEQFNALMAQARQDNDFTSEQFLNWFLKEQVEEVSSMCDLLAIVRAREGQPAVGRGVPRPRGHRRGGRRPDRASRRRRRVVGTVVRVSLTRHAGASSGATTWARPTSAGRSSRRRPGTRTRCTSWATS